MPFYRKPRNFTPLLIEAEKKSVKNGLHHAIFTSRFDRYKGDWKKDLKEGKHLLQQIFLSYQQDLTKLTNTNFH